MADDDVQAVLDDTKLPGGLIVLDTWTNKRRGATPIPAENSFIDACTLRKTVTFTISTRAGLRNVWGVRPNRAANFGGGGGQFWT